MNLRVCIVALVAVLSSADLLKTEAQSTASTPHLLLTDSAKRGKKIFEERCFLCHDVDSERVKPLGPSLNGLFKRTLLITGKPVTEENVKEIIRLGPTPGMPGFRYTLSNSEIDELLEYLKLK